MTRRSKGLVVVWLFTLLNLAGAVYVAGRGGDAEHLLVHVALAALGGYFIWHFRSRREERELPEGAPAVDGRLDRIEQSVDSIAIEVERMGEAQRFITKLVSERAEKQPTQSGT